MTRYLVASVVAAAALLAILLAQQPGGVDEIRARAAQDLANQAAYASAPGGTPEERSWEVLILMGAGDTTPADWSGSLSATLTGLDPCMGRVERWAMPSLLFSAS